MEDADVLDLVHQEGKKNIIESNYWWLFISLRSEDGSKIIDKMF